MVRMDEMIAELCNGDNRAFLMNRFPGTSTGERIDVETVFRWYLEDRADEFATIAAEHEAATDIYLTIGTRA